MTDLKLPLKGYALWLETEGEPQDLLQSVIDELAQRHGTRRFGAHATLIGLLGRGYAQRSPAVCFLCR